MDRSWWVSWTSNPVGGVNSVSANEVRQIVHEAGPYAADRQLVMTTIQTVQGLSTQIKLVQLDLARKDEVLKMIARQIEELRVKLSSEQAALPP